ncbi:thermonuclease family protein [Rhodopseudomonas sp. P2A-2r]|nr:thermonuclease family protein [Rhodopseudomonas sp. P2A-2r]UZE52356.1 thermonuclease family protein [Rhodopseudomonas sp. P2A-2r]
MATAPAAAMIGCSFEPQGAGRVSAVIDSRTFRLDDGREVRLAGIEFPTASLGKDALAALIAGREVTLHGDSDMPDRYGRQPAFAFVDQGDLVQQALLSQGVALASAEVTDPPCAALLKAAEAAARRARRGIWGRSAVIKNAESPGDILTRIGQFTVVEGRVRSVRQAGTTTYLNFGRRWTQDFAVTISRRMMAAFEGAGISPKSLETRQIRVRGWVELRNGPRIEALRVGQLELVGDD